MKLPILVLAVVVACVLAQSNRRAGFGASQRFSSPSGQSLFLRFDDDDDFDDRFDDDDSLEDLYDDLFDDDARDRARAQASLTRLRAAGVLPATGFRAHNRNTGHWNNGGFVNNRNQFNSGFSSNSGFKGNDNRGFATANTRPNNNNPFVNVNNRFPGNSVFNNHGNSGSRTQSNTGFNTNHISSSGFRTNSNTGFTNSFGTNTNNAFRTTQNTNKLAVKPASSFSSLNTGTNTIGTIPFPKTVTSRPVISAPQNLIKKPSSTSSFGQPLRGTGVNWPGGNGYFFSMSSAGSPPISYFVKYDD